MTDIDRYTREYVRHYEEGAFELHAIAARRAQVLTSVHKYAHDRILEVGCGMEPCFPYLEDYTAYAVVEPSEDFARRALRFAEGKANVRVVRGYLEDLVESLRTQGAFDFVIVSSLLHEVPDPSALLQAIRRLSTPSTTIHINVPNVYSLHRLLALEMGLIRSLFEPSATDIRFQRHTRFNRESLLELVEENGFRVLHFETYLIKPFTHDQMDALLRHGIIDLKTVAALDAMTKYLPQMGSEMFVEARVRG
jgi:SAM-dependent methyltransferase